MKRPDCCLGPARWVGLIVLAVFSTFGCAETRAADAFELKEGDRVVFLGGTFIEREQTFGYIETALTARFADRTITFRNLGWSGDTVWGEARSRFGPPAEGFAHLKQHVEALKPTVLFVNYGLNESFAGAKGLPDFEKGLNTLLDVLDKTGARIVLITPRKLETLPPPLPNPGKANERLASYVDVLKKTAHSRHYRVVDLFTDFSPNPNHLFTDNEVHLGAKGYEQAAQVILISLSLAPAGSHALADPALTPLRETINAKNELYFHRWRPQNETYLFGFRKHEQGNNAREIPLFDPLVAAKEADIAKILLALSHTHTTQTKERSR